MPDEQNPQTTEPTPPAAPIQREMYPTSRDRQDPPSFKLPDKFKSPEDLLKAYTEAEQKITEYGTKYKNYDDYAKIGPPEQIKEALDWARNVKDAMDRGLLKPAAEREANRIAESNAPASAPWDNEDWAYKQPQEQFRLMNEFQQTETRKYIDGIAKQYETTINGFRQTDGREKSILLKTMQALAKNPQLDPNELLNQAAKMAQHTPEELLDMVMESRLNTPEMRSKEIEAKVAERLAEEQQKWENKSFNDLVVSRKPKFQSRGQNRQAEDREILQKLSKEGFKW